MNCFRSFYSIIKCAKIKILVSLEDLDAPREVSFLLLPGDPRLLCSLTYRIEIRRNDRLSAAQ